MATVALFGLVLGAVCADNVGILNGISKGAYKDRMVCEGGGDAMGNTASKEGGGGMANMGVVRCKI